jgi:hypothetical protein
VEAGEPRAVSRSARRNNRLVWGFLIFTVVMVNPPVVQWVNDWAKDNPLLFGWPTLWLWLEFWYMVMIVGLFIFAFVLPSWKARYVEEVARDVEPAGETEEG